MKQLISKKMISSVLLTSMLGAASFVAQSAPVSDRTSTEAEIKALEQDIQQMNEMLESLNKQRTSVQSRIHKSDQDISELQKEISTLEAKLKEGQGEVKKLQSRQNSLTAQTEQQKKQIAKSLKSMYLGSSDSRLKLLLNQEDPEEISRQLAYLEYVQKAQLESIRSFETSVRKLKEVEQQQRALLTRLSQKKEALADRKKEFETKRAARKTMLESLNVKRQNNHRELSKMEKQREQLQKVLASLNSLKRVGNTPFSKLKGKMPRPLMGKVLYGYNEQRPDTRLRWPGIFITNTAGIPVKAVHDGRIIFSDWMRGYGLLTIVDHGDDYLSLYAHALTVLKHEGDVVMAGEPLAVSGQTGGQLNPGIYFEIRKKGNPENPNLWLEK